MLFRSICRSRVRMADCKIPLHRNPSSAKARPFLACNTKSISPFHQWPPDLTQSEIPRSARRKTFEVYTSSCFSMIRALCSCYPYPNLFFVTAIGNSSISLAHSAVPLPLHLSQQRGKPPIPSNKLPRVAGLSYRADIRRRSQNQKGRAIELPRAL